jgi:carboxypeptidase Q
MLRRAALPFFALLLAPACAGNEATPAFPLASAPVPPLTRPGPAPAAAEEQAPSRSDGKPDLVVVNRIKEEAFRRGQVMDLLFWLTDVNGPRLTGSPGLRSAADWAVRTLGAWGASNPHLEPWGHFARAWTVQRFELSLVEPSYARLAGVPKAWSRGTAGAVTGALVAAPLYPEHVDRDDRYDIGRLTARVRAYVAAQKGKLRGKLVLIDPPRDLQVPKEADAPRLDDKKLSEMTLAPELHAPVAWTWPLMRMPRDPDKRADLVASLPFDVLFDFYDRSRHVMDELWKFFADEGVLGVFGTDDRGEGALVFAESTGAWEASQPWPPPVIAMAPEDYDRLARLADKKVAARVRLDDAVATSDKDEDAYNVVAELPGGSKHDEVVILGAHLDSWHAGTGATDNGAGSAVMLEAMRILKALGLPLDRTVRLVLWTGEEQGLRGSRAYVKEHFGDPVTMALKPEHAKVAGYFNLDNGSGRIRGVYLQGNDMARPVFEQWLAPFKDEGAANITLRDTGGTDHLSFDAVGLPGFQFIQDPLDYSSRTHHSSLDVYEHAQAADLMQAAAIVASVVYDAANRPDPMPRKPLPPPLPAKTAGM